MMTAGNMPAPPHCKDNQDVNTLPKPLVSFIVPVLNGEGDIARCLLSIRNLDFPQDAYELLTLDNGSTDRTHQILRDLACDFEVVPKVTVSALRNRGAVMARGEYVAFIDADVELAPHWLQSALETLKDCSAVAGGCFPAVPKDPSWVQRTWDLHQRGRKPVATLSAVPWLPSMNLIVRRNDFLAVGGFNEQLETAEDVDLCYRLGQRGRILFNPAMEAIHWGEAKDLQTFWRKEVWRGIGNLKGVFSHGLRWDEIPSLGYPLYTIVIGALFGLCIMRDIWYRQILLAPWCLVLLIFPALALALNTARVANCANEFPKLFLLYFTYGVARAYSLIKVAGRLSR